MSKTVIRAELDRDLKDAFEAAVKADDERRTMSQVLRDLMREYIHRHAQGVVWEPGAATKGGLHHDEE